MKKNILSIAVFCLAAMSLAGCKTDEEPQWETEVIPPVVNPDNSGDNGNNNGGGSTEDTAD